MRIKRALALIITLLLSVSLWAAEKPYDNTEYQKAVARFSDVVNSGDTVAIRKMALEMQKQGRKTGNYRVEMLYYEAMNYAYLYAESPLSVRMANYQQAIERAKQLESNKYYWGYKSIMASNTVYEDLSEGLEQAEAMLHEATETKSTYGILKSYSTLGDVYSYRGECMTTVKMLEDAEKLGEADKDKDNEIAKLLYDDIYTQLATAYAIIPDNKKACETLDKMEKFLKETAVYDKVDKELRMLDIKSQRAQMAFGDEDYKKFAQLVAEMKQSQYYEEILANPNNIEFYFETLLYDGHDTEAREFIETLQGDVRHYYLYTYYKYKGDYKRAMEEYDAQKLSRDSLTYKVQQADIAAMDSKIGKEKVLLEKERLQNRQRVIVLGSAAGILAIIIIFITVLYLRNRKHTKVLADKNAQLKIAKDEAETSRDEAVRANNAKTHFIQNMTHEIHTPINAINGFASLLADPSMAGMFDEASLQEMYKAISDSSLNLSAIIDNIVTITDFEASNERPVMRPMDIASVVSEAMASGVQPDASAVNFHSDLTAVPEGFELVGNTAHTKRILENLINNAVKFTEQGEILVSAFVDSAANKFVFSVKDTGKGIPEGSEEVIFDRFKKLDEFIPGTGLGLSVCRAIANKINAEVVCDVEHTKLGEGSTFLFSLPIGMEAYEGSDEKFSYNANLGSY